MKKVFFGLILGTLILNINDVRADDTLLQYKNECLSFIEKPKTMVTSSYGKLIYNYEKDQDFLIKETRRRFKDGNKEMPEKFYPAGLTKVRDGFDFNMDVGVIGVSQGHFCLFPKSIKAHLGFYVPTIYILNNLAKDSCMYSLVVRHENTHMQIYIEALDYFLPILKETVDGLFDNIGVDIVGQDVDREYAAKQYNKKYLDAVMKKVSEWREDVEKEQLKLDTMENYILENKICSELEKLKK